MRDMVRRRYIRKTDYEVSFKKDDGIVMRKISPTAAEEIKMSPREHILSEYGIVPSRYCDCDVDVPSVSTNSPERSS